MEDMLSKALPDLLKILDDQGVADVTALNIHDTSSWADYLVVGTVNSRTQAGGAERKIREYLHELGINLYHGGPKGQDSEWILLDCGNLVINLMTAESRNFYQLEELWFEGVPIT